MNLRIPGPTPCPPQVLQALSQQMIAHRGPEFTALLRRVTENLKKVFFTRHDVLLLTSSGTGAMEAAIVNFLSSGDRVLALSAGHFGERFAKIAEKYGVDVRRLEKPWGEAIDSAELERELVWDPQIKAVLAVHHETSTGVTHDLAVIARVTRKHNRLSIVDAVSSLGAIPVLMDSWELDVVISASQKGLMSPPGLAMIAVSARAWQAHTQARTPRFYFDLAKARDSLSQGLTAWTSCPPLLFALDAALGLMLEEGMTNVFLRHKKLAKYFRCGVRSLGLNLFAKASCVSSAATAIEISPEMSADTVIRSLKEDHGVIVAGGQGRLTDKIIRVGHMGWVSLADLDEVLRALKMVLAR